ncbi:nitrite reductase/ring-hydroxylating ferredoxin subunit [Winogradskyella epiphytica]|uniref:Nitrite reductase/ring-hydroxylating ferredoxin subunit n=1 Tax=Winogradskyella epiphytica TaxID=262005 RepID=A0A2V4XHP6_9FLAO|nr:hypothetical protein [Winogradskyella epiphytica]PYE83041.1 nitrite reductase/ring-hydroxylating ferredoxin subunit [Winogradskyella epiphytica]GGW55376.1 hypothetical protein GCM10008085_03400 [Winogradskyella epiphytica]
MKKLILILSCVIIFGCSKNDPIYNCNYLIDVGVNLTVNLNLPQYNQLLFPVNAIRVEGYGNKGIILVRTNANSILAWDGGDPNHPTSACSTLTINGFNATCGCDDGNEYSLITGTALNENPQPCTLKPYRVEDLGNNVYLVTN